MLSPKLAFLFYLDIDNESISFNNYLARCGCRIVAARVGNRDELSVGTCCQCQFFLAEGFAVSGPPKRNLLQNYCKNTGKTGVLQQTESLGALFLLQNYLNCWFAQFFCVYEWFKTRANAGSLSIWQNGVQQNVVL